MEYTLNLGIEKVEAFAVVVRRQNAKEFLTPLRQ